MNLLPNVDHRLQATSFVLSFAPTPHVETYFCFSLQRYLNNMKNEIAKHAGDWDRFKKYTNPHEYIHSAVPGHRTSVCMLRPISRSFYKMIEIGNHFGLFKYYESIAIRTFHLAEGPGGFIEAVWHQRSSNANAAQDAYFGITLHNSDVNIPGWSKLKDKKIPNFVIVPDEPDADAETHGDITEYANFRHCATRHRRAANLITADGGFDFTNNFNDQETMATRLIVAEVLTALTVQALDGSFVLKIYDVFTKIMVEIIYVLSTFYKKVHLYKPASSRPANSEKYIVCMHLKHEADDRTVERFGEVMRELNAGGERPLLGLINHEISCEFRNKLQDIINVMGQNQLDNIIATIGMIVTKKTEKNEAQRKVNIANCVSWCKRHNMPYYTEFD